jgi:hypothetical protein
MGKKSSLYVENSYLLKQISFILSLVSLTININILILILWEECDFVWELFSDTMNKSIQDDLFIKDKLHQESVA